METSLTRIGYKIPYTDKEFKRIKNDLVVKPFIIAEYDYGNKPFPVYRKNDTHIYMPKYYGIEKYGIPQTFNERLGNNIKLKFKGKLHDYQQDIMNEVKDIIYSKDSCVLSIPPGGGKTICALWMISQLGKKTLILVHKEFLLNQWIERIEQFLPEARIGIIQQNKVDIEDKDIVIGMIQSIVSRKYPREIFDSFALTTVDECFPYSQLIVTEDGPQKIGYIYRMWEKNEKIPKVLSFNKETNILEYKKITYAWKKINDELLKINYGQGSIECTYNHKILTPNGYVEAKNLDIGDLIKCSLQEKEIGTVKIKSIEKIKNKGRFYNGKVYDIEVEDNHNFVLSTGIKNKYGPIVHNCHRICSRSFSQALFHVGTKYSLGLSATPHRKDGLSKLLNWFLGDIVTPDSKCKDLKPIIKIIKAKYDKQPEITYNMRGKVNIATLITTISMDPIRNQLILDEITQALKDNRKILVMTERRVQCEQLEYLITKQGISMSVGIYIGGMTNEALEETNTRDIIISTYAMTAEGYDNKKIDTLIMATPRSEIEQILGRCMRQKNKNDPLVIDIVDNLEGLGGQAIKRERYYRKKGYIKPKPKVNNKKYMFLEDE